MDNIELVEWIQKELIPNLIKNDKFLIDWNMAASSKLVDCKIEPLSVSEAFMVTNCYKIKVTLSDATGNEKKEFGIVLKTLPKWIQSSLFNRFEQSFKNEIVAYTELLPALKWTDYTAKYYYSHLKENGDICLALSDFTFDGYRMSKAKGKLSLEHIYEAVKLLGKFHGFSYALKHTNIETFNRIKNNFKEARFLKPYDQLWTAIVDNGVIRTMETVRKQKHIECNEMSDEFLNKLEKLIADTQEYQRTTFEGVEPYALLCHGDYLRNNIAFKYCDEEYNTPTNATLFDFQAFRYASPMADLSTFMANSTGTDVRSKHFDYIFRTYHNEMIDNYCNLTNTSFENIPDFMSYDSMLLEYVRFMPFGLSIAAGFLAICLDPSATESINNNKNHQEIIEREYERGGEVVNKELRALVYDMYNFYKKYNLEL